jgi:hypothetical protein
VWGRVGGGSPEATVDLRRRKNPCRRSSQARNRQWPVSATLDGAQKRSGTLLCSQRLRRVRARQKICAGGPADWVGGGGPQGHAPLTKPGRREDVVSRLGLATPGTVHRNCPGLFPSRRPPSAYLLSTARSSCSHAMRSCASWRERTRYCGSPVSEGINRTIS